MRHGSRAFVLVVAALLATAGRLEAQGAAMDSASAGAGGAVPGAPLAPAFPPAPPSVDKSPRKALALGLLIPGGGQFYAGRPAKGTALLLTAAGGLALTASGIRDCALQADPCTDDDIAVGLVIAAGAWVGGALMAPRDARAWNRAHGAFGSTARPHVRVGAAGGVGVGLELSLPRAGPLGGERGRRR